MVDKRVILLSLFLAFCISSCGPSRPSEFAGLPSEVHVVFVGLSPEEGSSFRFLDTKGEIPSFPYRAPQNNRVSPLEELVCSPRLGGSAMCPSVEIRCLGKDGDVRLDLELRRDGRTSARLGPPWDTTPDDLVEARLLVKPSEESSTRRVSLSAQLVEGMVDATTLEIRGQPRESASPWFNQLSTIDDQSFVAVHEAHPHYEQVLLTLSLLGKVWAANSSGFVNCGFSR